MLPDGAAAIAIGEARILAKHHAGVIFCTCEAKSAIGAEREPVVIWRADQFNTTIYGYSDRFRGIEGTRDVVLMCEEDIALAGLTEGQAITLFSDFNDGKHRELSGLTVRAHKLPRGTIGGYYPECNVLNAIDHHDASSKTPAAKAIPVRLGRSTA